MIFDHLIKQINLNHEKPFDDQTNQNQTKPKMLTTGQLL